MGSVLVMATVCLMNGCAFAPAAPVSEPARSAALAVAQPPIEAFAGEHDVELLGATVVRDPDGRRLLRGRLRASSQHRLSAARRLSIEGVAADGASAWRVECAPRAEPVRRRSRVKCCAAFEVALPAGAEGSRIRIGYARP